jgi:hypothetical protein
LLAGLVVVVLSRRPPQDVEEIAEVVAAGTETAEGTAAPVIGAA